MTRPTTDRIRRMINGRLNPMVMDEPVAAADEALFLLAPFLEHIGDHEGASTLRIWAMETYPAKGNA